MKQWTLNEKEEMNTLLSSISQFLAKIFEKFNQKRLKRLSISQSEYKMTAFVNFLEVYNSYKILECSARYCKVYWQSLYLSLSL